MQAPGVTTGARPDEIMESLAMDTQSKQEGKTDSNTLHQEDYRPHKDTLNPLLLTSLSGFVSVGGIPVLSEQPAAVGNPEASRVYRK